MLILFTNADKVHALPQYRFRHVTTSPIILNEKAGPVNNPFCFPLIASDLDANQFLLCPLIFAALTTKTYTGGLPET